MAESYVAVRDEPRHRRRFENEFVRVYDVLVPPGDTTLYHHHSEDTFSVSPRCRCTPSAAPSEPPSTLLPM